MSQAPSPRDPRMEKFLDGLLTPDEMGATRRAVEADPELRRERDLQRWIDSELNDMFEYDSSRAPVVPHEEEAAPEPIRIETRRPGPRWRVLAAAAVFLLAGAGVYLYLESITPRVEYAKADDVYSKLVSTGFKPTIICTTDEQFREFTEKRLGTPIVLAAAPHVEALGWAYASPVPGTIVGGRTSLLYTKVDGKEVLVLMDANDRPADHPITVAPPLHVFKEQVGGVTTYEITPLNEKRVVNNLRVVP